MDAATAARRRMAADDNKAAQGWQGCHFFVWRFLIAAWLALGAMLGAHATEPDAPLYRYETAPASDQLDDLAPLLPASAELVSARVRMSDSARTLAELQLAQTAHGPVLLAWQALVDDPFLTLLPPLAETVVLAPVLQRHVSGNAAVLAWWDVSRQIRLLADADVVFGQPLGDPLFVPANWREQAEAVRGIEQAFWQEPGDRDLQAGRDAFQRFVAALLAPEQDGMAALRELGDGRPVVLVLHLRDLILLGQMAPEALGVAFRDFGTLSEVHGMIQRVRAWMRDNDYAAYGLLRGGTDSVRAVALTDEASGQTLVARLLPVIGNDQTDVAGARLVYRTGGYIVFEIAAQPASTSTASTAQTSP